ncbi:exported hypothetical protein [Gammaproteobacteria bacterium]
MYRGFVTILLAMICWSSSAAFAAQTTSPIPFTSPTSPPSTAAKTEIHVYPLVLAVGALAGVVTVNYLTYGVGTLPTSVGMSSSAPIISPAAAAASRVYVITSAVLGAWAASALYGQ